MSDNTNQMNQIRELLFGEQIQHFEARFNELADKFEKELSEAKAEIRTEYDKKLAIMKQAFKEAEKDILDNMVNRDELAHFLTEIASKLSRRD